MALMGDRSCTCRKKSMGAYILIMTKPEPSFGRPTLGSSQSSHWLLPDQDWCGCPQMIVERMSRRAGSISVEERYAWICNRRNVYLNTRP